MWIFYRDDYQQTGNSRIDMKTVIPSLRDCLLFILMSTMYSYINTLWKGFKETIYTRVRTNLQVVISNIPYLWSLIEVSCSAGVPKWMLSSHSLSNWFKSLRSINLHTKKLWKLWDMTLVNTWAFWSWDKILGIVIVPSSYCSRMKW